MCRFETLTRRFLLAALTLGTVAWAANAQDSRRSADVLAGIGRTATPAEVRAWDIDVRPDFKGLPTGQGSVRQGEVLWEAQCASCHGSFGESSNVFTPLAGGTTAHDVKTGRVAGLMPGSNQPQRTTLMKVSTLSTLWDYINRAMPWNAPKSLSVDEVYAVTAYILNLNNVLAADFTLSDRNIRDVQAILPNRHGMTQAHAMWPGKESDGTRRPDVQGSACMRNCQAEAVVKSFLPDYVRNAHGNLASQSRSFGPVRGTDTTRAPNTASNKALASAVITQAAIESIAPEKTSPFGSDPDVMHLLQKNTCLACHGLDSKLIGPSFQDISGKYKDRPDAVNYLSGKIRSGGQGVWGVVPMPAQSLGEQESAQLAKWLVLGAAK